MPARETASPRRKEDSRAAEHRAVTGQDLLDEFTTSFQAVDRRNSTERVEAMQQEKLKEAWSTAQRLRSTALDAAHAVAAAVRLEDDQNPTSRG